LPLPPAEIEALIAQAEADIAILKLREQRDGGAGRDPSDPADPQRCLELWLAALYASRPGLPRSDRQARSISARLH
jgi:hypothetical protein